MNEGLLPIMLFLGADRGSLNRGRGAVKAVPSRRTHRPRRRSYRSASRLRLTPRGRSDPKTIARQSELCHGAAAVAMRLASEPQRRLAADQADPRGGKSHAAMRIFLSC